MMVKEKNYLINEAAKEVHVESHVLRYWEEELQLPIKRNEQGHRIYTQEDIDKFIALEQLYDSFRAKGIQIILSHVNEQPRSVMDKAGFTEKIGEENFCIHIDEALERAHLLAEVENRLDTKAF